MTDRKPDDLFDALRDRLADYGQEPPAPLWANIRAQLPPPVAAPQLRHRARRRMLAALALLLFIGLGTWQGLRLGGQQGQAGTLATHAPSMEPASSAKRTEPALAAGSTRTELDVAESSRTATVASGTVQQAADGLPEAAVVTSETGDNSSLTTPATDKAAVATNKGAIAANKAAVAIASTGSLPGAANHTATKSTAARPQALAMARATIPRHELPGRAASRVGADANTVVSRPAAASVLVGTQPAINTTDNSSKALLLATDARNTPGRDGRGRATSQPTGRVAGAQQPNGIAAPTQVEAAPPGPELAATAARETWQPMLRPAPLLLPSSAPPALVARADSLPPLPVAAVRRWAVQALAGSALTSRTLYSGGLAYAPAPSSTLSPTYNYNRTVWSTGSAADEQATTGFAAEVQLQRQLTGRWSLGTGLGYHVFAADQAVNVRVTYGAPNVSNFYPDSVSKVYVRNTYQFLTLPLRVGYQLGTGHARLRYGLRAGADVAFYLGGRSTEGSTYGGTSRTYGPTDSPYRSLSLALSLGAEVRYQLAPGWELLAQPTLTHFATSVTRPASGYVARYPLAATALVGVAYWLR